jgi:hypothetical protein
VTDAGVGDDSGGSASAAPLYKAVVLGADFSSGTGIVSRLDLATLSMQTNAIAGVATSDPVIRHLGDKLYIVNRFVGENVTILDAKTLSPVDQISTGANSNPQDVAVVGDKLYVPAFGGAGVVTGKIGDTDATMIDLNAAVGSSDGKPDCVGVAAVDTDIYVTCENLVSFAPASVGKLVVIDSTTDTIRTHIDLPVQNPQNLIAEMPDHTLVVSSYDKAAGCTMQITPGATPTATCLVSNSQLAQNGAEPTHIAVQGGKIWFAATTDYVDGGLRSYDTATSMMGAMVAPASENIRDIAVCPDGKLVVADTAGSGGLRVYNNGAELTTAAIAIGLPPGFGNNLVCY